MHILKNDLITHESLDKKRIIQNAYKICLYKFKESYYLGIKYVYFNILSLEQKLYY